MDTSLSPQTTKIGFSRGKIATDSDGGPAKVIVSCQRPDRLVMRSYSPIFWASELSITAHHSLIEKIQRFGSGLLWVAKITVGILNKRPKHICQPMLHATGAAH